MATNTLIQRLEAGESTSVMHRRQTETFIAAEAIASGDLVSLDLSQAVDGDKALKVVKADSGTATDTCAVGFAVSAATAAGQKIEVCIAGICEANVDAATVAGTLLQIGATAGRAAVRTVAVDEGGAATFSLYPIVAVAAEADTANVATVFVFKQF